MSPPAPRLAPWTTAVYVAMWAVVVLQGWGPLLDSDPLDWLQQPARSAERMTLRDIERAGSVDGSRGLEQAVIGRLYGTREEALLYAVEVHRELLEIDASPELRARTAVLSLEAGQPEAAFDLGFLDWASLDETTRAEMSPEIRDMALLQNARATGAEETASEIEARIRTRGERWKQRSVALLLANLALVAMGAGVIALGVSAKGPSAVKGILAGDGARPPWPLADGVGVFVRGDFWNRFYFLLLVWLSSLPALAGFFSVLPGSLLFTWGTLFASLPLVWLVAHHLLSPSGLSAREIFGIPSSVKRLASLIGVGFAAIAVDLVGTHAISWGSWWASVGSSWAEGYDETLVWGSTLDAGLSSVDYLVWTPVFEELAFRGLLYFSLRQRFGPVTAALVTATLFALLHFYSLPGFLMTLWSGLVWAFAFEHSRSLVPGIAAHAVYNGLYVAGIVLLYR